MHIFQDCTLDIWFSRKGQYVTVFEDDGHPSNTTQRNLVGQLFLLFEENNHILQKILSYLLSLVPHESGAQYGLPMKAVMAKLDLGAYIVGGNALLHSPKALPQIFV